MLKKSMLGTLRQASALMLMIFIVTQNLFASWQDIMSAATAQQTPAEGSFTFPSDTAQPTIEPGKYSGGQLVVSGASGNVSNVSQESLVSSDGKISSANAEQALGSSQTSPKTKASLSMAMQFAKQAELKSGDYHFEVNKKDGTVSLVVHDGAVAKFSAAANGTEGEKVTTTMKGDTVISGFSQIALKGGKTGVVCSSVKGSDSSGMAPVFAKLGDQKSVKTLSTGNTPGSFSVDNIKGAGTNQGQPKLSFTSTVKAAIQQVAEMIAPASISVAAPKSAVVKMTQDSIVVSANFSEGTKPAAGKSGGPIPVTISNGTPEGTLHIDMAYDPGSNGASQSLNRNYLPKGSTQLTVTIGAQQYAPIALTSPKAQQANIDLKPIQPPLTNMAAR